jgi:hypothetical protein
LRISQTYTWPRGRRPYRVFWLEKEPWNRGANYFDNDFPELTGWKARMYDFMRKLDTFPSGDKEKVLPYLNYIHMFLESLNDRIAQLKTECPIEWDAQKKEVDGVLGKIQSRWTEVSANMPW